MSDAEQYEATRVRFREHLKRHGMTQGQAASALSCDQSTVSRWVNDKYSGSTARITARVATWLDAQDASRSARKDEPPSAPEPPRAPEPASAPAPQSDPEPFVELVCEDAPGIECKVMTLASDYAPPHMADAKQLTVRQASLLCMPSLLPEVSLDDLVRGIAELSVDSVEKISRSHARTRGLGSEGEVYIAGVRGSPLMYKVGRTARGARQRIRDLQTGNPGLHLLASFRVQDAPGVEEAAHAILAPYRVRADAGREWFACSRLTVDVAVAKAISSVEVQ